MFSQLWVGLRLSLLWFMVCLLTLVSSPLFPVESAWAATRSTQTAIQDLKTSQIQTSYGKLPVSFEANQGQTDSQVNFLSRGRGYSLFLTPSSAVISLSRSKLNPDVNSERFIPGKKSLDKSPDERIQSVVNMKLIGANNQSKPQGLEEQEKRSNYFIGNDPSQWHIDIPNYGKVKYGKVYPGIDLVYYGNQNQLEYDFVVAAGADPKAIQLQYEGAENLALNDAGELVIKTEAGELIEKAPIVYQEINGKRQPISGTYRLLENNRVAFGLGAYDPTHSVVIDPVLVYSTYLGGSSDDDVDDIAVDSVGNAYVTGTTSSTNFPTQNPLQAAFRGGYSDAFISKLNSSGNGLIYSTYLGGNDYEGGQGISVDKAGNVYVTGTTYSQNFPTLNPFQSANGGSYDAFVSKINSSGNGLIYSTYLGGDYDEDSSAIAIDISNNAYITGTTSSTNFPTRNPLQAAFGGGSYGDAFVSKLNSSGNGLIYSTYLGGNDFDVGFAIAVNNTGNAYVTGYTTSTDFPIQNPLKATLGGTEDGFVAKLNSAGNGFIYSTYLGGNASDIALAIAIDNAGYAYVTGYTESQDFPNFPNSNNLLLNAYVIKLNLDGNQLIYSSFIAGNSLYALKQVVGYGIAVDNLSNAYVTGNLQYANNPNASGQAQEVAYVSKLNAGGKEVYCIFLGGSAGELGAGIATDNAGNAYFAGNVYSFSSSSTDFPTLNPLQANFGGGFQDGFVSKISSNVAPGDLNADGLSDLLFRKDNSGDLVIWRMNGIKLASPAYLGVVTPDWKVAGTSDFNSDENSDILWQNDNGDLGVWYMNGIVPTSTGNLGSVPAGWKVATLADFNLDGNPDILLRKDNGLLFVWYMNGIVVKSSSYLGNPTVDWKIAGTGDFNADGKPDLLWRNDNGWIAVWYMDGLAIAGTANLGSTTTDWKVRAIADYSKDGKPDLVLENDNGTLAVWYLNGVKVTGWNYLNPNQVDPSWKIVAPH